MSEQFQELLLKQLPRLGIYAMALTRSRPDANDLVQATAERILRSETQFEMGSNFSAWSYRVLKNIHISNCRRSYRHDVSLDQISEQPVLPPALVRPAHQEEELIGREVIRVLDGLSPSLRKTMALVCEAQLSHDEASKAMACSVGTVKSRLWRARAQVKNLLAGSYDDAVGFSRTLRPRSTWIPENVVAC
jgi:RNA polymerase sigma-70 factor, ECF subfamily